MTDEHEQKQGPGGPSFSNLIGDAVVALGDYAEAMRVVLLHPARGVSEELAGLTGKAVAALDEYRDRMALVLVRLGEVTESQDRVNGAVVGRFDAYDRELGSLESALGMRRWDDPEPTSTAEFILGPKRERPSARHDFTERELVAMDREALRAQADILRVEGFDGSETTIEIPLVDPLGTVDKPVTSVQFNIGEDGLARRKKPKADLRVVFGARCSWWDTIDKADQLPSPRGDGLPCCPHCRSVLYEVPSEAEWWAGAELHETNGHPGYRAMIEWGRGRCFPTPADHRAEGPIGGLVKAYQAATGEVLPWTGEWTRP